MQSIDFGGDDGQFEVSGIQGGPTDTYFAKVNLKEVYYA
jgi:hypothetical protein